MRDKTGKFAKIKDDLSESWRILTIIFRTLPILLILIFFINYLDARTSIADTFAILSSIGNKNCKLKCISQEANKISEFTTDSIKPNRFDMEANKASEKYNGKDNRKDNGKDDFSDFN